MRACVNLLNFFLVKVIDNKATFVFDISNKKFNKVTIILTKVRQLNVVKQLKDIKFLTIIKDIKFLLVIKDIEVSTTIEDIIFLIKLIDVISKEKSCLFIMRRILY